MTSWQIVGKRVPPTNTAVWQTQIFTTSRDTIYFWTHYTCNKPFFFKSNPSACTALSQHKNEPPLISKPSHATVLFATPSSPCVKNKTDRDSEGPTAPYQFSAVPLHFGRRRDPVEATVATTPWASARTLSAAGPLTHSGRARRCHEVNAPRQGRLGPGSSSAIRRPVCPLSEDGVCLPGLSWRRISRGDFGDAGEICTHNRNALNVFVQTTFLGS